MYLTLQDGLIVGFSMTDRYQYSIEISDKTVPEDFTDSFAVGKWKYENGEVVLSGLEPAGIPADYIPEPSLTDRIAALEARQTLTETRQAALVETLEPERIAQMGDVGYTWKQEADTITKT